MQGATYPTLFIGYVTFHTGEYVKLTKKNRFQILPRKFDTEDNLFASESTSSFELNIVQVSFNVYKIYF